MQTIVSLRRCYGCLLTSKAEHRSLYLTPGLPNVLPRYLEDHKRKASPTMSRSHHRITEPHAANPARAAAVHGLRAATRAARATPTPTFSRENSNS